MANNSLGEMLKTNPLKRADLDDFVACYNAENRHQRKESECFKSFTCEDRKRQRKHTVDRLNSQTA